MRAVCAQCGADFVSYNKSPRYCSRACKDRALTVPIDIEALCTMYASGKTQAEIAAHMGVSQKVVWGAMQRNGLTARVAAKRNQWGKNNHLWKGAEATNSPLHNRLYTRFGKATHCSRCGRSDPSIRYEYANLTGQYESIDDYAPMCVACHRKYDSARRDATGDRTMPERLR